MKQAKPKLLNPSLAAAMIASASHRLSASMLQDFIAGLAIKPHGQKDRSSGRGSINYYWNKGHVGYHGSVQGKRECARRVRQMAKGMIPANLVHPV